MPRVRSSRWLNFHYRSVTGVYLALLLLWVRISGAIPIGTSHHFNVDKEIVEERTKHVAKKVYESYNQDQLVFEKEAHECILGSSRQYLWWLDRDGKVRLSSGLVRNIVLDLAHFDWTEKEAMEYLKVRQMEDKMVQKKIIVMSLAHNNFARVPYDFLAAFKEDLEKLSLKANPISTLVREKVKMAVSIGGPKSSFPAMKKLRELDLRECDLRALEPNSFSELKSLKKLILSHNKIMTIKSNAFNGLKHLQHLDLSFNRGIEPATTEIQLGKFDAYFSMLQGLAFYKDTFSQLEELVFLDLSYTKLQAYSGVALAFLGKDLRQLSLCYTQIPLIGDGMFQGTQLQVLDLSGNPMLVPTFDVDSIAGIEDTLEILRFDDSYLKHVGWIEKLTKLKVLLLENNNINQLPDKTLSQLTDLAILDLSSNHLGHWYTRHVLTTQKLQVLDLRDNNINVISKEMIGDFQQVEYLAIGRNNFLCNCLLREFLEIAVQNTEDINCVEKEESGREPPPLTIQWADEYDAFARVLSLYLEEMSNSREIILNHPRVNLKEPVLFSPESSPEEREYLEKLVPEPEPPHITQFSPYEEAHRAAGRLVQSMRVKVGQGRNTDVYCNHTQRRVSRSVVEMEKEPRPEDPSEWIIKMQLLDYSDEDYRCMNSNSTVAYYIAELEECSETRMARLPPLDEAFPVELVVIYPILTVCTIGLIAAIYYFRGYDIRYFCITFRNVTILSLLDKDKRKLLRRRKSTMVLQEEFDYDVFVSYSEQNRDWVLEHFLPNIERSDEINVCMHERDFKVGLTILENIISCMDQSRCILLVLSKSFVSSNWCQFELHLAQHRLLETRREQLILVLLEDIPRINRPRTLQYLMRTKTYLEWPADKPAKVKQNKIKFQDENALQEQRKVFWKRLKEAIVEKK